MTNLNLWTKKEYLTDESSISYYLSGRHFEFNEDLQTQEHSLTIYHDGVPEVIGDCFVSPSWDKALVRSFLYGLYDYNQLSTTYDEYNLIIHKRPFQISDDLNVFLMNHVAYIVNDSSILDGNFNASLIYLLTQFASDYNFNWNEACSNSTYALEKIPGLYEDTNLLNPFVFITEDPSFNPDPEQYLGEQFVQWIDNFCAQHHLNIAKSLLDSIIKEKFLVELFFWNFNPLFRGIIFYDGNANQDTYNENRWHYNAAPVIYVNYDEGHEILDDIDNNKVDTIDLYLQQYWNENVESFNVIGQINGSDTSKNILLGCLYDGCWNQGASDSAVGIGIMLAIEKYFKENNIVPMFNLVFAAFSGEEAGAHGAYSYAKAHEQNLIPIVIDLNQFAFNQPSPPMALWIFVNQQTFNSTMKAITDDTGFTNLVNDGTIIKTKALDKPSSHIYVSDHDPFLNKNHRVFSLVKESVDFPPALWLMHHHDGLDHTEGDTVANLDSAQIDATADVILNITKYLAIKSQAWFAEDPTITLTDTHDQDNDPDSLTATFPIGAERPHDHLKARAILISKNYPILKRYMNVTEFTYQDEIVKSLKIDLPRSAPKDYYNLRLYLYNLTGEIDNSYTLFDNQFDNGRYSNDKFIDDNIWMSPPNDPPNTPQQPQGDSEVQTNEVHTYTTSTTDPNNDNIWYQWKWETKILGFPLTYYTTWVTGGPYQSGATCSHIISWSEEGTYNIWVRAKDDILNPNVMSDWSPCKTIHVTKGDGESSWNTQFLDSFSQDTVAVNQQTSCDGFNEATSTQEQSNGIVNWTWDFGDGHFSYGESALHSYTQIGNYTIHLSIHDDHNNYLNCSQNITVLILNAGFRTTGDWQPGKQVRFNDTSAGLYPIVNWTWDFSDGNISYTRNATHNYSTVGCYNVTLTVHDNQNHTHQTVHPVEVELIPPELAQVVTYPNPTISGTPVTIAVDLLDNQSGIKEVKVNITTPYNTTINATMVMTNLTEYDYTYIFNDTWQPGVYNYSIWVEDHANNTNDTPGFTFTILPTPIINYEPPTPNNASIVNHAWTQINATVQDNHITSAFINWNHSLKGYWPMDFYDTTGVFDNSTYGNFGKFEGGMTTGNVHTGKYGKAVEFDGTNDDFDLGANNSLHLGTGNFTFIVWENSDQTLYAHKAVILTNRPADASAKGYIFGLQNTAHLYVTQASSNNVTLNGHTDVTDHTWHHIAYVRQGTNYSIYVDAAYDAGITDTAKNITNTQHTYLAYGHWSNNAYFDGLLDEPQLYNRALSREEINASYNNGLHRLTHNFTGLSDGTYQYFAHAIDTTGNQSTTETRQITIDTTPPSITTVSATPNTVGFGYNVTISTNVTDGISGVKNVSVNLTYPAGCGLNPETVTMTRISGTMYRYVFSNTWHAGCYNYTIIAYDNVSNMRTSPMHSLNVTVNAMMSIATLKDSYTGSQYINLTDPPNPFENLTVIGRGLTWNSYYNDSSGCNILESYQGPVNYQDVNGSWSPINSTLFTLASNHPAYNYGYRTGNTHGLFGVYFKPDISSTWPVALTYNRSNDPSVYVVRSKLVGVGYVDPQSNWAYQYLQGVQSSQGQTNGDTVTYPGAFTGTDVSWSYGNTELKEEITMSNTTKTLLQTHPPHLYGLQDASSYLVFITKLEYQNLNFYNESGILVGNVTIADTGVDLRDSFGCFKCGLPLGDAWELVNESVRQKLVYRIVHLNGETYLFSGLKVSTLSQMMFPVVIDPTLTVYSTSNDGYIFNSGNNYNTVRTATTGTVNNSGTFISIGQKMVSGPTYYVYRGFVFFNTTALPSNAYLDTATLSLYKKDDFSTTDFDITIQNGQPTYPHDAMQSGDYNKNNYVGNGGSLNTAQFSSGYNEIKMTNLNWITKGGTTKLCLRSSRDINGNAPTGNEYVNVYSNEFLGMCGPKLVVVYRNQSKIKDTGSTNIKGYLLIQVQAYNTQQGTWIVDKDTINETSPRIISGGGGQLALDTIFNGHVRSSDLTHGTGTYRVYAAFRDPYGNILRTDSGVELKAWWNFTKT